MKSYIASLAIAALIASPVLAQEVVVDHLQGVIDEAVERTDKPVTTLTSDGGSTVETINTESGWHYPEADHPAFRPPFAAEGGE